MNRVHKVNRRESLPFREARSPVLGGKVRSNQNGKVRIPRADLAVDAGRVIHPDRVKAQFEGAAVFGTRLALMGEITAADGRIRQSSVNDNPVARINEAPFETHVHLAPSEALPAAHQETQMGLVRVARPPGLSWL